MTTLTIDAATLSLWATDAVLLGLAYLVGRVHGAIRADRLYREQLGELMDEVIAMRRTVERLCDLEAARYVDAPGGKNAPAAVSGPLRGHPRKA